jgi:putative membrane protein
MRRSGITLVLLALLAVLGASACGGRQAAVPDCRDYVASPSARAAERGGTAGAATRDDSRFVCYAGVSRLAAVAYGLMAQKRSANPTVLRFAERTIDDNKRAYAELDELARQQDAMTMPTRLDEEHAAIRSQLSPLAGDAFDRAYVRQLIAEDRQAMQLQQEELARGNEPLLKRYAVNAMKKLQEEIASARQVAVDIGAER